MQLTPEAGTWLSCMLLCSLKVGADQRHLTCGPEEFLQAGSCRPCPQCADGEQLSAVCGDGLGAGAECVPCPSDHYSNAATRHRCWPCTNCSRENKVQEASCTPSHNAVCGRCLEGYFQFPGLHCHHCSIEPTNLYCKDWLAQQTTTQPSTVKSSSTEPVTEIIKPEHVTQGSGQHYFDWRATIPVIVLAVILLIIVSAYITKKWKCILSCCLKTHENSTGEDPEKQDLGLIEQATSPSQQNHGNLDSSNLEDEFNGTTDGAAVPPGDEGGLCSTQEPQNGQATNSNYLADLRKKAAEATADMKLEDLNQDLRDDLAMQLSPEPTVLEHKNWRHFASHFKIDNMHIDYWKGQKLPMMHVIEHLEKNTHVTVAEIINAIQFIGRVKVEERFCQKLLNDHEEYN